MSESNAEYTTRQYHNGDEQEIVPLLDEVFHGWPHMSLSCSSMEHWRWKYQQSPRGAAIVVTEHEGAIVGCHHGPVFDLDVMQQPSLRSYGTDMAVHPEHRRRGIMGNQINLLGKLRVQMGVTSGLILGSNPINIRSVEKRSPKFPFDLVNLIHITDIDRQLEAVPMNRPTVKKLGYAGLKTLNRLRFIASKPRSGAVEVEPVERFDERADRLWRQLNQTYDYALRKDSEYLNWRYLEPEAGFYTAKAATEGDEMVGYTVQGVNSRIEDYPVGFITELHAAPGRTDVLDSLLAEALESFREADVNLVNYMTFRGHRHVEALSRHGFLDSRIKFKLFYKTFGGEDAYKALAGSTPDRVHFSWGDHDTLPVKLPTY